MDGTEVAFLNDVMLRRCTTSTLTFGVLLNQITTVEPCINMSQDLLGFRVYQAVNLDLARLAAALPLRHSGCESLVVTHSVGFMLYIAGAR